MVLFQPHQRRKPKRTAPSQQFSPYRQTLPKIYKHVTSYACQLRDISILLKKKKKHTEGPETDSESEGGECGSGEDDGEENDGTESEVSSL